MTQNPQEEKEWEFSDKVDGHLIFRKGRDFFKVPVREMTHALDIDRAVIKHEAYQAGLKFAMGEVDEWLKDHHPATEIGIVLAGLKSHLTQSLTSELDKEVN